MAELNLHRLNSRVHRALSVVGKGIKYRLGEGGYKPTDPTPTRTIGCDCTGYVSWCLEMRRDQRNAGKPWSEAIPWLETTAIYKDAVGARRLFVPITKPVPGCLVVYPDKFGSQGHIGIVTVVNDPRFVVADCSSSRGGKTREAIRQWDRTALFVSKRAIFCVLKEDFI